MWEKWRDDDGAPNDEWNPEPAWTPELSLGDPDAWRSTSPEETDALWRGDVHIEQWPEWDAGPEYQMWKRRVDDEE